MPIASVTVISKNTPDQHQILTQTRGHISWKSVFVCKGALNVYYELAKTWVPYLSTVSHTACSHCISFHLCAIKPSCFPAEDNASDSMQAG